MYMEPELSWYRKKKELEQSTAAGLSVLLRPRVGRSVAARGVWTAAAGSGRSRTAPSPRPTSSSSSLLSAAVVREMLAAQRLKPVTKKPRGPFLTPSSGVDAESQKSCATKAEVAPESKAAVLPAARTPHALAKRVARRMLRRRGGASPPAPAPEDGGTKVVMTCCCPRLPPGLRCALHQRDDAPGRPWTRDGGGTRGWAFSEYARWRRSVWVPSRFYLERASSAGPEERAPPRPARLIERTARSGGVSVRRFLLVVDGDPEQSGSGM